MSTVGTCSAEPEMTQANSLLRTARAFVNRLVRYEGTNGNEYDRANYGEKMVGTGLLKEVHQVGQKVVLIVEKDDIAKTMICVDAVKVSA